MMVQKDINDDSSEKGKGRKKLKYSKISQNQNHLNQKHLFHYLLDLQVLVKQVSLNQLPEPLVVNSIVFHLVVEELTYMLVKCQE